MLGESRVSARTPTRLEVRLLGAVEVILDGELLRAFTSVRLQRFLTLIVPSDCASLGVIHKAERSNILPFSQNLLWILYGRQSQPT